jgi:hypothetical protein
MRCASDKGGQNVGIRAVRQESHVVPNGANTMANQGRGIQSSQSRSGIPFVQCGLPNVFSAFALVFSGEVLQVLGFWMHDVEMGRRKFATRILRAGWESNPDRITGRANKRDGMKMPT